MDGPTIALLVLGAAVVIGLVWAMITYNQLVFLRQKLANARSQIDVQLTRRHDLIPNLTATVQGYLTHEREIMTRVAEARSRAQTAKAGLGHGVAPVDPAQAATLSAAEGALSLALGQLLVVVEAYPELQGHTQTGRLMEELASAENRIAFARQHCNDAAMQYNTLRESFPTLLLAGPLGFNPAGYLEFPLETQQRPDTSFAAS